MRYQPYKHFDLAENQVDAPMLIPALIPEGCVQHWDSKENRYILIPKHGKRDFSRMVY